MTWVAVAVGVGSAAVGAYSANKSASAQRDAAKAQANAASQPTNTDQSNQSTSTTSVSRGNPEVQQAVQDTLGAAQGLYQQNKANPILRRGVAGASGQMTQESNALQQLAENPNSNADINAASSYLQRTLAPQQTTGGAAPTLADLPPALQAAVNSHQMSLSQAAANAAANRPAFAAKFGATGQGTPAPTQQSNENSALGNNPVAQDLLGRLQNSSLDANSNALQNFINAGGGGTGITAGGGGANIFGAPNANGVTYSGAGATGGPDGPPVPAASYYTSSGGGGIGSAGGASGNYQAGPQIQDNSSNNSLFSQNAKAILAGKYLDPNDPTTQNYIKALNNEANTQLQQQLSQIAGKADAVGMYGGSGANLQQAYTRTQGLQGMDNADATALMTARGQGLDQITSTLGDVNTRDIAGSADATQLSVAAQNAAASGASSAAALQSAAADRAQQLQLTTRAQNLTALGDYVQNNQFGISQLGGLASGVDAQQNAAAGLAAGLNSAQYTGLGDAFNAASAVGSLNHAASSANSGIAFQNANAQETNLNNYLAQLGVIGGMEGSTSTNNASSNSQGTSQGPQYAPAYTTDPTGAAISGALGGGLAAWGALGGNSAAANYNANNYAPAGGVLAGNNGAPVGGVPGAYPTG